jgi:hypothetical protein
MKKRSSWYTKGSRPERNTEAAFFGGALAFLTALSKDKPRPWLYAVTGAAASASSMNEHRLAARARANARATGYAEIAADVFNKLLDLQLTRPLPRAYFLRCSRRCAMRRRIARAIDSTAARRTGHGRPNELPSPLTISACPDPGMGCQGQKATSEHCAETSIIVVDPLPAE